MSDERPAAAGRRSARALITLSVLLLLAAALLVGLHAGGVLRSVLATSPSIDVALPAGIITPQGMAEAGSPEVSVVPAPAAPGDPETADAGAAAPGNPAPDAAMSAGPVPAEPAPEPSPAEPPAAPQLAEAPPAAPAEQGGADAVSGPGDAASPAGPEAAEPGDAQTGNAAPETAGAAATAEAGHPDAAEASADAERAAQTSSAPPAPAPKVPELPSVPAPELSAETPAEAPEESVAGNAAPEEARPGAEGQPGPADNPQVAAATVPPGTVPTWQRLARPFPPDESRPRIAVVVAGLGLSEAATTAAIQQLPAEVTLSFSPYSNRIEEWVAQARAAGHEVLIDLPMEPASFPRDDPGPQALLTSLAPQANAERLAWTLSRTEGFLGVSTFMGSRFTTSVEHMRPVIRALGERGLMILDSRAAADSLAASLAAEQGVAYAINDRFIDNEASRVAIDGRLQQIERIARTRGVAVAMGYAYPVTIERLREWARGLAGKGLTLAPISAVADRQLVR